MANVWQFSAPYPEIETVIVMPTPSMGDTQNYKSKVLSKQAMNGDYYTHVQRNDGSFQYAWEFKLTREKVFEFRRFVGTYTGNKIQVMRHDGSVLVGVLKTNPLTFDQLGRNVIAGSVEGQIVRVEFEVNNVGSFG